MNDKTKRNLDSYEIRALSEKSKIPNLIKNPIISNKFFIHKFLIRRKVEYNKSNLNFINIIKLIKLHS